MLVSMELPGLILIHKSINNISTNNAANANTLPLLRGANDAIVVRYYLTEDEVPVRF